MPEIVFVDDDADILDLVEQTVGRQYDVAVFDEARAALACLRENGARLLVTDLRMPGLNGFMLIDEARALIPELKVLLISAFIDSSSKAERSFYERYTPHCLSKPFTFADLVAAIGGILQN